MDVAATALRTWEVGATKFLRPPEHRALLELFKPLSDVSCVAAGGYEDAERRVLLVGRPDVLDGLGEEALADDAIAAVAIEGKFEFDAAGHRDFLGSVLKLGIEREFLGDIIVLPDGEGAQVVATPGVADMLEASLTRVRSVTVSCKRIPLDELRPQPLRRKDVTAVEASLRLDAVASGGMGISRGVASDMAKAGDILLNWRPAKAAKEVASGDVITIRGAGRVEVHDIDLTAKGKFRIKMTRLS
uniref:RNA-binding S4 domain-containing protein n=1 Tax=Phaeomonas parva TaxID=124430 RepID=A0A7S1U8M0_9STRA